MFLPELFGFRPVAQTWQVDRLASEVVRAVVEELDAAAPDEAVAPLLLVTCGEERGGERRGLLVAVKLPRVADHDDLLEARHEHEVIIVAVAARSNDDAVIGVELDRRAVKCDFLHGRLRSLQRSPARSSRRRS